MRIIEVKNLSKNYNNFEAVRGISFELEKNEVLGILGPNGAGKTTTIKCILGFLNPSRGEILIKGHTPFEERIREFIGFLPEETYLPPYFKVKEILYFGAKLWGIKDKEKRVNFLLDFFELRKFENKEIGKLSRGNLRKVGIAYSILHDPEIIIWDEPTEGLDPFMRKKIVEFIRKEKERGKSFIFSSHVLSEVEKTADKVIFMKNGKILTKGNLKDFIKSKDESLEDIFFRIMQNE